MEQHVPGGAHGDAGMEQYFSIGMRTSGVY